MNLRIRSVFKQRLSLLGRQVIFRLRGRHNPIRPWDTDKPFNAVMEKIKGYTIVDTKRCFMLYQLAKQAAVSSCDAAEVGVYRGGSAKLLAEVFRPRNKPLHLFDTFAGMPPSDEACDLHKQGDFRDTSLGAVREYLRGYENINFYPGFFPATAKPAEKLSFCLVHIDVDIYRSVMDCCEFFYPRMERSGIMVFDDYGLVTCPGAKLAVDEFFADKTEKPWYFQSGQCVIVKR
jgi:O-methyltransferase